MFLSLLKKDTSNYYKIMIYFIINVICLAGGFVKIISLHLLKYLYLTIFFINIKSIFSAKKKYLVVSLSGFHAACTILINLTQTSF